MMLSYRTTRKVGTRFTISHLPNRSSFLFSEISLHSFLRDNPSKPVVMRSVVQKVKDDKTCGGYCERRCSPRCQAGGIQAREEYKEVSVRFVPAPRLDPYLTQRSAARAGGLPRSRRGMRAAVSLWFETAAWLGISKLPCWRTA
jgi:hypothetical protein